MEADERRILLMGIFEILLTFLSKSKAHADVLFKVDAYTMRLRWKRFQDSLKKAKDDLDANNRT